jgi:hypothetical protein
MIVKAIAWDLIDECFRTDNRSQVDCWVAKIADEFRKTRAGQSDPFPDMFCKFVNENVDYVYCQEVIFDAIYNEHEDEDYQAIVFAWVSEKDKTMFLLKNSAAVT